MIKPKKIHQYNYKRKKNTNNFRNNHLPLSNRMFKHRCLKSVIQWQSSNEWIQSSPNVTIRMKIQIFQTTDRSSLPSSALTRAKTADSSSRIELTCLIARKNQMSTYRLNESHVKNALFAQVLLNTVLKKQCNVKLYL